MPGQLRSALRRFPHLDLTILLKTVEGVFPEQTDREPLAQIHSLFKGSNRLIVLGSGSGVWHMAGAEPVFA